MFAIGVKGVDMSGVYDIFEVYAYSTKSNSDGIEYGDIYMYPCTIDMWPGVKDIESKFYLFSLEYMLCPNSSEHLDLFGDFFTENVKYLHFAIKECSN